MQYRGANKTDKSNRRLTWNTYIVEAPVWEVWNGSPLQSQIWILWGGRFLLRQTDLDFGFISSLFTTGVIVFGLLRIFIFPFPRFQEIWATRYIHNKFRDILQTKERCQSYSKKRRNSFLWTVPQISFSFQSSIFYTFDISLSTFKLFTRTHQIFLDAFISTSCHVGFRFPLRKQL